LRQLLNCTTCVGKNKEGTGALGRLLFQAHLTTLISSLPGRRITPTRTQRECNNYYDADDRFFVLHIYSLPAVVSRMPFTCFGVN